MRNEAPVVVVGAGFGGLAAAVELARRGARVTVVEQHADPGGKARAVELGGRIVDIGPTVLTMRWVFDELFEGSGRALGDVVALREPAIVARHAFADGSQLDLHRDVETNARAIAELSGARESEAYRRYAASGEAISEIVRGPFLRAERPSAGALFSAAGRLGLGAFAKIDAHRTMWRSLTSLFEDDRLRALFGRYATYVGSSPLLAPATLNVIAHVEREGVTIPEGGMTALARAVADLAARLGVTFRWSTAVTNVVRRGDRVAGVAIEHADGTAETLEASAVIANADVASIAHGVLGPDAVAAVGGARRERDAKRSLSAVTWAIVGRASGFPLVHHNVFFSRDYRAEHEALFARSPSLAAEPTVYVCAPDRGGPDVHAPAGTDAERFFIIVNAPALGDRAPLSTHEVDRCETGMFSVLSRAGLTIEPKAKLTTTPSDFEAMARGTGGALYGEASHGAFSALGRPSARTKLRGFYLTGGSVHPGAGVPMAALSGRTAARLALEELTDRSSTSRSPSGVTHGSTSMP